MKVFIFIFDVFKKFPLLFIANIALLVAVSLFGACSLFTISPIVDFLVHPDLKGISPFTEKAVEAFKFIGLPVNLEIWVVFFIIFITLSSVFHVVARYSILKTKYAIMQHISHAAFEDFFNARGYFFTSNDQGVLLNTLTREAAIVGEAFDRMGLFFASLLQIMLFLIIPFCISWQVTIISFAASALSVAPFILLGRYCYRMGIAGTDSANHMSSVIQENLNLAKVVLGFGNQKTALNNFDRAFDDYRRYSLRSQILQTAIAILYRPFGAITLIISLFAARRFGVPLSEITVMLLALMQVGLSLGYLISHKNAIENFLPSHEQIERLRGRARQLAQTSGDLKFKGFERELRLEGVSFGYPGREPVLTDINIRIPKGRMVAIIGESGAGKSTLIDMVMGFHQSLAGRIVIDGLPIQDFDINSYRSRIGYVPQDSVLFNTTIMENLLWARAGASMEEVERSCAQANASEFISRLPKGYNTVVGDRGVRLSGGQVQRIALARAILRKPELLILDEATSSLDTYSERLIQQAIDKIAKETTVIVIAHRLSTITNADYVYVLQKGRIVEEGTHQQLANMNGHFSEMVRLQALGRIN